MQQLRAFGEALSPDALGPGPEEVAAALACECGLDKGSALAEDLVGWEAAANPAEVLQALMQDQRRALLVVRETMLAQENQLAAIKDRQRLRS